MYVSVYVRISYVHLIFFFSGEYQFRVIATAILHIHDINSWIAWIALQLSWPLDSKVAQQLLFLLPLSELSRQRKGIL